MTTETDELEVIIRSTASGTGFATASTEARGMNAEMAAMGAGFSTHGSTVVTAEKDITREADSMARALGSAGEQGAKAVTRFEALGGVLGSSGVMGVGVAAGLVGLTAVIEGTRSAIENTDKLEASTRSLAQAYDSQGQSLANQGAWIQGFLNQNRRYIDDQYAARDAIASLVRAGYDQATVQRISNDALDLAVAKGEDYTTAVTSLNKALQGNTMGLRDLGLSAKDVSTIMGEATKDNKELAKAHQDLTRDTDALVRAQQALQTEHDRLSAKRVVSAADLDVLHQKQKAVADLNVKVTADQNALAGAQGSIATTGQDQAKLLDTLEPKLRGARGSTSDLKQSQDDLNRSWQDAGQRYGPALTQALANAIDIANYGGQIEGRLNPLFGGDPANVAPALKAALGAPPSTAAPRTQQNLLGNPDLTEQHIVNTGLAYQRAGELADEFGTHTVQAGLAMNRAAEFSDGLTANLGKQRDESDTLTVKNAALTDALYQQAIAQNEVSTRTSEVMGKWRDAADEYVSSGQQIRDQLGLTAGAIDTLAAHARSEKVNVAVNVDYSAIEQAQQRIDDLVAHAAGEHTINFVPHVSGFNDFTPV